MSLYNALFGVNPMAPLILLALNTTHNSIPRFRDAYLNEAGEMVIYTRTGGGNRDYYDSAESYRASHPADDPDNNYTGPFNEDLRKLEGFLGDEDDSFDSTYASFRYSVPPAFKPIIDAVKAGPATSPQARWQALLKDLGDSSQGGTEPQTPEGKRALEVGQKIFFQMNAALDKEKYDDKT